MARPRTPWRDRFQAFLDRAELVDGCLIWPGAINSQGYGIFTWFGLDEGRQKRSDNAHRVAWLFAGRPIPDGFHVDHLCHNRPCINLAHLEPVTPAVNAIRSEGPSALNAAKTHCDRGHELTGQNLYERNGRRHCRRCRAENSRSRLLLGLRA